MIYKEKFNDLFLFTKFRQKNYLIYLDLIKIT